MTAASQPPAARDAGVGELLPCLFCGSVDGPDLVGSWAGGPPRHYVSCDTCDAAGPSGATEADAVAAWNRRAPLPPAGNGPAAEAAARAFETAVADYGRAAHDAKDRGFDDPAVVDAAIAVFIAHRAAVADADAAGYARAMAEVDAACASLYDHDGGGRVVMIGQTRARHRGKWHAWPEEVYEPPAPDAPTATAALIAAAATLAAAATPTLVNGGPPRDGLDDGR